MRRWILWLRLGRNIAVAVVSAVCVLPFTVMVGALLEFKKMQELELVKGEWPMGPPFSYIDLAGVFLMVGTVALVVLVGFWAFVAANKLWPIRKVPEDEKKE